MHHNGTASANIMLFIVCHTERIAVYPGRHLRFFEICSAWLWATAIDVYLQLQTISLLCGSPSFQWTYKPLGPQGIMVAWEALDYADEEMFYSKFTQWPFMKWQLGYWDIWLMQLLFFSASKARDFIPFHFVNSCGQFIPSMW